MKNDEIYLIHILESIEKIESYLKEGKSIFMQEELLQDAILRNLQIMAESTQRLSNNIKLSATDIPWQDIADFRNKLVHDYLGIDLEIIYDVIENELPQLKKKIALIKNSLNTK